MNSPGILLADEPIGDLDEEAEAQVLALLERYHAGTGATLIIVTHDPAVAARAGRCIRMTRGRLISSGVYDVLGRAPLFSSSHHGFLVLYAGSRRACRSGPGAGPLRYAGSRTFR